jgi:nitrogen fixation protein NifU and related proteins
MNLYQEKLLDHYKHPRHHGSLEHPTFSVEEYNPSCGDRVIVQGIIDNDILQQARFTGTGCVISQAATSILLDTVVGQPIDVISNLTHNDILKLIGIALGPTRIRCALLGLEALIKGIHNAP